MKNKTKVVLGLSAMLAGTVGIAGVSTFAWFTTQNTAQISFANANVKSESANISIAYRAVANNGITNAMHASDTSTKIDISGASINVRDLSGDGVTFYYPTWDDFATLHASGMNPVTIGNFTSTKQYFVTFGIDITNHGADTTKVFINSSAGLAAVDSATNTASTPAMQSTRVAIWDCGTGSDPTTLKTIWQYSDAGKGTGYTYLAKGETSDTAYNVSGYKLATPETATFHEGPFSAPSYTTTTAGQLIHTFAHVDEVAHLTVMMWIEGTLTTALDACIGGIVSLSLPVIAFDPGL